MDAVIEGQQELCANRIKLCFYLDYKKAKVGDDVVIIRIGKNKIRAVC